MTKSKPRFSMAGPADLHPAMSRPQPAPYLDPNAIENLRAINPDDGGEFLRELINIFLADTPVRIAEIEQAAAAGCAADLMRAAHSIKGSAANFGAMELTQLARELENLGRAGNLAVVCASLESLRSEFARLLPALEKLKVGG